MKHGHLYDANTGLFTGRTLSVSGEHLLAANVPAGMIFMEGEFDPLSQRVELATGLVADYVPEQPSADHEWDGQARRWKLSETAATAKQADLEARHHIAVTEAASLRSLREALIGDSGAVERLRTYDATIAGHRANLKL